MDYSRHFHWHKISNIYFYTVCTIFCLNINILNSFPLYATYTLVEFGLYESNHDITDKLYMIITITSCDLKKRRGFI